MERGRSEEREEKGERERRERRLLKEINRKRITGHCRKKCNYITFFRFLKY